VVAANRRRRAGSLRKLSEAQIVDATLRIIRREGTDGLSMRALGEALGVTPMAIYNHFPSKDALLKRVADWVLAEVATPAPARAHWKQQLKAYALESTDRLAVYPGLIGVVLANTGELGRHLQRHAFDVLLTAGFDERTAKLCIYSYHTYMFGVLAIHARFLSGAKSRARSKKSRFKAADASRRDTLPSDPSFREWMEFGIDAMLAGFANLLAARKLGASTEPKPRSLPKKARLAAR
jgi:AcrR family transcriptional regulator